MLKIGQNWRKIENYPPQCSTKIGTPELEKGILKSVYRLPFKPNIKNYQYYMHFLERMLRSIFLHTISEQIAIILTII